MEMLKARSVKLTESFLTPNFEDICWKQSDENYSSKSPENYLKTCSSFLGNFNVYLLSAYNYYTKYRINKYDPSLKCRMFKYSENDVLLSRLNGDIEMQKK